VEKLVKERVEMPGGVLYNRISWEGFPESRPKGLGRTAIPQGKEPVKVALAVKAALGSYLNNGQVLVHQQLRRIAQAFGIDERSGRNPQIPPEGPG
jgi:hypothetical protein